MDRPIECDTPTLSIHAPAHGDLPDAAYQIWPGNRIQMIEPRRGSLPILPSLPYRRNGPSITVRSGTRRADRRRINSHELSISELLPRDALLERSVETRWDGRGAVLLTPVLGYAL